MASKLYLFVGFSYYHRVVVVLLSLTTLASCRNHSIVECPPWFFYNLSTNQCQCYNNNEEGIHCTEAGVVVVGLGNCVTHEKNVGTFFAKCFYFQLPHGNVTANGHFLLPSNVSELNDYMCGPMNRKGLVCSKCIDGFGPSVTSFEYKCTKCSDSWSGTLFYILVEFGPITLYYFIILTFRISITSAPMTCFVLYSQIIVYAIFKDPVTLNKLIVQSQSESVKYLIVVIGSLYGIWNLDFLKYIVPPICISSKLSIIHIEFLSCLSALYSLFLVVLTWICVELHGRNFRPLVLLWRSFHRCFVRLRKGWDTRNDIIDVFATFLLLTNSKLTYQSVQMLLSQYIIKDGIPYAKVSLYDPYIIYMSTKHLPFVVLSLAIILVFVVLPSFILLMYPTRTFSSCLTICKLNGRPGIALQTFVEKYYGCYRDKLSGGYDMRGFSALYFILRPVIIIIYTIRMIHSTLSNNTWFFAIVLFVSVSLLISFVKPYKKTYMNFVDTLLLALLSLLCLFQSTQFSNTLLAALGEVILLSVPMIVFLFTLFLKIICKLKCFILFKEFLGCKCWPKIKTYIQPNTAVEAHTYEERQQLIPPAVNKNVKLVSYSSI